jgi:hypothetical protein
MVTLESGESEDAFSGDLILKSHLGEGSGNVFVITGDAFQDVSGELFLSTGEAKAAKAGDISITVGISGDGSAGKIFLTSGTAYSGNGGDITLLGGSANGNSYTGGAISLSAGTSAMATGENSRR